jgi:hypothetical protein
MSGTELWSASRTVQFTFKASNLMKATNRTTSPTISIVVAIILLGLTHIAIGGDAKTNRWRGQQTIWWNDAQLVTNAIVSVLAVQAANPALQSDRGFSEHRGNVTDLVLVLDNMNDPRKLAEVAGLTPYYLGEAPSQMYYCVLLRKGTALRPVLENRLSSAGNECINRFGSPDAKMEGLHVPMCLSDQQYRRRLQQIVAAIEQDKSCAIEQ